ncbi:MAG: hypothetical protein ACM359_00615 [Bacillota bacterium]
MTANRSTNHAGNVVFATSGVSGIIGQPMQLQAQGDQQGHSSAAVIIAMMPLRRSECCSSSRDKPKPIRPQTAKMILQRLRQFFVWCDDMTYAGWEGRGYYRCSVCSARCLGPY